MHARWDAASRSLAGPVDLRECRCILRSRHRKLSAEQWHSLAGAGCVGRSIPLAAKCAQQRSQGRSSKCSAFSADAAGRPAETVVDKPRIAVFVSGGGSNFRAIHQNCAQGRLRARVQLLVSDKPGCGGWRYAEEQGIPTAYYNPRDSASQSAELLVDSMHAAGITFAVLAGYLKLLPPAVVAAFPKRFLNVHPGLLPRFGGPGMHGRHVHAAVLKAGVTQTGVSVHFVDEEYDRGPVLLEHRVPVLAGDTPESLAARVLEQEHRVYTEAIAALVDGRVVWQEGVPRMLPAQT